MLIKAMQADKFQGANPCLDYSKTPRLSSHDTLTKGDTYVREISIFKIAPFSLTWQRSTETLHSSCSLRGDSGTHVLAL